MFVWSLFTLVLCQGNPFWKLVRNLLKTPDQKQIDCQHPKPILLDTGEMKLPYDWAVSCRLIVYVWGGICYGSKFYSFNAMHGR